MYSLGRWIENGWSDGGVVRSGPCLLAFVELAKGWEASASSLRAHAAAALPAYMVPQQVHLLEAP